MGRWGGGDLEVRRHGRGQGGVDGDGDADADVKGGSGVSLWSLRVWRTAG